MQDQAQTLLSRLLFIHYRARAAETLQFKATSDLLIDVDVFGEALIVGTREKRKLAH